MKKLLLQSLLAAGMFCVGMSAQAQLADGKYYLQNTSSSLWWGAGNSWGTQASLVKHAEYVTLHPQEDGTYQLESQVSNGGAAYYFNGSYMDNGAPVNLTITEVADGVYTIANGNVHYGYNGTNTIIDEAGVAADSENARWKIFSEADMQAQLADATPENPVDATFLILDPNFGRNNRNYGAWTFEASNKNNNGNVTNFNVESWHAVFNMSQTLQNAPKGLYALTAQGFYRQDGTDNEHLPVFFANDETQTFPFKEGTENSMSDASASFSNGLYKIDPIFVEVAEDGQLTIGAKLEDNTTLWCIWDNFELTYYGSDASADDVKFMILEQKLEDMLGECDELLEDENLSDAARENLLTAMSAVGFALDYGYCESVDDYNQYIDLLNDAMDKAEGSIIAKKALDKMHELIVKTNFYTEEALEAYYGAPYARYLDGTMTKVEAVALQDPSLVTGWHAAITVDNFLLSVWDTNPDFQNAPYYINTWSVEGDSDGSDFRVPFFEYWTGDANSLGEKTLTATLTDVPEGSYNVKGWVRVRIKNDGGDSAYGITLQANDGTPVDVTTGEQVGSTQFRLDSFTAKGTVGTDGELKVKFDVAADNNISWLSFKNMWYELDPVATGITTVNGVRQADGTIYNLAGQRVEKTQKGLYIVNGKKVLK